MQIHSITARTGSADKALWKAKGLMADDAAIEKAHSYLGLSLSQNDRAKVAGAVIDKIKPVLDKAVSQIASLAKKAAEAQGKSFDETISLDSVGVLCKIIGEKILDTGTQSDVVRARLALPKAEGSKPSSVGSDSIEVSL